MVTCYFELVSGDGYLWYNAVKLLEFIRSSTTDHFSLVSRILTFNYIHVKNSEVVLYWK